MWPPAKQLRKLGETRGGCAPAKVRQILERVDEAMRETQKHIRSYMMEHPEFSEVGNRMLEEWKNGGAASLSN